MNHRRAFLQFVAASPLLANGFAREVLAQAGVEGGIDPPAVVTQACDALDILDLERAARQSIPPAHWGYLISGVDGEETLQANREAFARWQLRTHRLIDLSKLDMTVEIFGTRYSSPIYLSALGAQRAFHADGELGSARAAKTHDQLLMLSTATSTSVEEVAKARGAPIWYQLYATSSFDIAMKMVRRAELAGCRILAITVDVPIGRNLETFKRWKRLEKRSCTSCHGPAGPELKDFPMFDGLDMEGWSLSTPLLTWDFIRRVKDGTRMKVLVKGLESSEDAARAVKYGFDGVVVSNHGGRGIDTGRGTLECLPEVVKVVKGKIPVFMDGGIRRGTDAVKALALGATAVGIGRPYVWGLGAFGEAGVDRALTILNEELRLAMAGVGARSIREITPAALSRKV